MATLINKVFANKTLVTAYGKIEFSADGTAEVKDFIAKKLSALKGFTVEESVEKPEYEESIIKVDEQINEEVEGELENEDELEDEETSHITRKELEALTVKQLEKYAKENGIDLTGATKKVDIISVILGE